MLYRCTLILLSLFLTVPVLAQKKSFSEDPGTFIKEFGDYLIDSKNKQVREAFDEFEIKWEEAMGYDAKDSFIFAAVAMQKAHARPAPDFLQLMHATTSFYDNSIDEGTLLNFLAIIGTIYPKSSKTAMKDFFEFFRSFNKNAELTSGRNKIWTTGNRDYSLRLKGDQPIMEFMGIDLQLHSVKDTLLIRNTSGNYNVLSQMWFGKEGEVTWERAGLNPRDVFANLSSYRINMKTNGYEADSVRFMNYNAYDQEILGQLADQTHTKGENGPYPQFKSYQKSFTLGEIEDYLEYKGGFGMEGNRIVGNGTAEEPARLRVLKDGKTFMEFQSTSFFIDPKKVSSGNTDIKVFLGADTIIHPSLYLSIERENRHIKLSTTPNSMSRAPFFNSYHQVDMYADLLECNLDSGYIDIRAIRDPDGRSTIESANFFSRRRFEKMQGNLSYHPLLRMNEFYQLYHKIVSTERDITIFFGVQDITQIQTLLGLLTTQGFIFYDDKAKTITLKDKLFTYVNAYQNKIDFDVIQLNSVIRKEPNSRIYLEDYRMVIKGINSVKLSDSQFVEVYPAKQTITMRKNRDFQFDGYLRAGRFEYFGKAFGFQYEDFKIDMKQIDSMMFNFPDAKHGNQLRRVNTVIQNITGDLQIDKPDNKSGRALAPNYPIFDCFKGAYVYYDYKSVYGGVYDRERFFFKLKPFVVDSLDNFSMSGMNLFGSFKSANILPEFDQKLNLQPDFSLGFVHQTPPDGFDLYGGRGHCDMTIFLSNRGLRGEGKFTFNGAEIESKKMIFFPDSMEAANTVFAMDDSEKKRFPYVKSEHCALTWSPYADTMIIAAVDSNAYINMYEEESFLKGKLVFTRKKMYGSGEFNYRQSLAVSDFYDFKYSTLSADSSEFTLYDDDMSRKALYNPDVRIAIDFEKEELKGRSIYDSIYTALPINQYSTNIPDFRWDVKQKKLFLEPGGDREDEEFFFVSTNPIYDSLSFTPKSAQLSLETYEIEAFDIQAIFVADARIRPDSAIRIGENGDIPPLENAEITASVQNEYHQIVNASVNIFSSKKFTGFGDYNYVDQNGKPWIIRMPDVHSTDTGTTVGVGEIPDSMNFYFGPRMRYSGDINFISTRKTLSFDGELSIEHDLVDILGTEKLKFEGNVSYDSLYFSINEARNILGQELYSGMFMNTKLNQLYPLFLGKKKSPDDYPIYLAQGDLYFNADSNAFGIAYPKRIFDEDPTEGYFRYKLKDSMLVMDGEVGFDYDIENFKFMLSGYITYDLIAEAYDFKLTGGIQLPVETNTMKLMGDSLVNFAYFNPDITNSKDYIISGALRHIEKEKDIRKALNTILDEEEIPTFKEYTPTFMFSEVQMVWDTSSMSFRNEGPIALANIGSAPVNKLINGRIDFVKDVFSDSVSIYLESSARNWYYFTFFDENLQVSSSDVQFIEEVLDAKIKETRGKLDFRQADGVCVQEAWRKLKRKNFDK